MEPETQTLQTIHPLRAWREKAGLTVREFADRLTDENGASLASGPSISRIENGLQDPSLKLVRAIVASTEGAVTAGDFMAPPPGASPRKRNGETTN